MPPKTRKRKLPSAETLDIKEIQVQKKAACATQKPTRATKRQQLPRDILNDENSNSSRSLLDVVLKKKGAWLPDAKRDIRKSTDEVIRFIEEQHKQVSSSASDRTVIMSLVSELATILPDPAATGSPTIQMEGVNIFHKTQKCIKSFQAAIKEYETSMKADNGIKRPDWIQWKHDITDLNALSGKSLDVSLRLLNGSILTGKHSNLSNPPENLSEDSVEGIAWDLLASSRPKSVDDTWGATAQELINLFTGFMSLLSQED